MEGCCHGDLDKIYATMQHLEKKQNTKIDLLICCGDFQVLLRTNTLSAAYFRCDVYCSFLLPINNVCPVQAVRNLDDLECLACPPKYRDLKTFYRYYTGLEVAPYPTLFSESPSAPSLLHQVPMHLSPVDVPMRMGRTAKSMRKRGARRSSYALQISGIADH